MPNYVFTDETRFSVSIGRAGEIVHRIKALEDFTNVHGEVHAGDLGGFIHSTENLDHDSTAWVFDDAEVIGNARISGNAAIYENAIVSGYSKVSGNARIHGNATIFNRPVICGNADITNYARIRDCANIHGDAFISGNAFVGDHSLISGKIFISDKAIIKTCGRIYGDYILIKDHAEIYDNTSIVGSNITIGNETILRGSIEIHNKAFLMNPHDYIIVNFSECNFMAYKLQDGGYRFTVENEGDYNINEFKKRINANDQDKILIKYIKQYLK